MGMRYGLGVDFFNYKQDFYLREKGLAYNSIEPLFDAWMSFFATSGLGYGLFLFSVAFFQILFIFLFIKKENKLWLPFVLSFILSSVWLGYCNGLRQNLAFCVFVYAFQYIGLRKPFKYVILITLATLIHKSAALLIIFYPISNLRKGWINTVKGRIMIFVISLILMNMNMVQALLQQLDYLIVLLGYEGYLENLNSSYVLDADLKLGVGFFIWAVIDIICLLKSQYVKAYFLRSSISVSMPAVYDMYVVGLFINNAFVASKAIGRINYYFLGWRVIILAFTIAWALKNDRITAYTILFLLLLIFLSVIYQGETNTAIYIFNWQKDKFSLQPFHYLDI